jgi:hypothetical protein
MSRLYQECPELFPWVEETARQIEIDYNPDFQSFFREQERLQQQCTCKYDGGYGDDGREYRRTPKYGCPTHRVEDWENGVLFCPNCAKDASFTEHETDTETWLTCDRCGKQTDDAEIEKANKIEENKSE